MSRHKRILFSATPLILSNLLDMGVSLFALFLLKAYGSDVTAAYGLSTTLLFSLLALCSGILPATISSLGKWSHKQGDSQRIIFYSACTASLVIGFVVLCFFDIAQSIYIKVLVRNHNIIEHIMSYQRIIHWIIPFGSIGAVLTGFIIYKQKTFEILKYNLLIRMFSVPILWFMLSQTKELINPLSTIAWSGLSVSLLNIVISFYIVSKEIPSSLTTFSLKHISSSIIKRIFSISIPSGLELFLTLTSFSVFLSIISMLGTKEAAIATVVVGITRFIIFPLKVFGITTGTNAAISFAKNDPVEGKKWMIAGIQLMYTLIFPFSLLLLLCPDTIIGAWLEASNLPEASMALRIAGLSILLEPLGSFLSQVLVTQGIGKQTFLASSLYKWLITLPFCFYLGVYCKFGLIAIWLIHMSSRLVFAIGCVIIYRNYIYRQKLHSAYVIA